MKEKQNNRSAVHLDEFNPAHVHCVVQCYQIHYVFLSSLLNLKEYIDGLKCNLDFNNPVWNVQSWFHVLYHQWIYATVYAVTMLCNERERLYVTETPKFGVG